MTFLLEKSTIGILAITHLLIALFFLIWPGVLKQINIILKKWISIRKITKPLDMMHDIDAKILKISRIIGGVSLLTAVALIYFYTRY